ncbi:MAG TPA: hypothetical protein VGH47_04575, partial [Xanthobacteraceae bacterium]
MTLAANWNFLVALTVLGKPPRVVNSKPDAKLFKLLESAAAAVAISSALRRDGNDVVCPALSVATQPHNFLFDERMIFAAGFAPDADAVVIDFAEQNVFA